MNRYYCFVIFSLQFVKETKYLVDVVEILFVPFPSLTIFPLLLYIDMFTVI